MNYKKILPILCISSFAVTALTSIPLLINYIRDISPKYQLVVDLHVWFGLAFIIFVLNRILLNRKFVKAMILGVNRK
jgi:hypothetical protein